MALGLRLAMNLLARTFGLGGGALADNGLLLEDGVSFILLEDDASAILKEA